MDERLYNVEKGDLYIYPAFSLTQIHSVSDDLQGVAGTADFNFIFSRSIPYPTLKVIFIYVSILLFL